MCSLIDERQKERINNYCQDLRRKKTILTPIFGFIAIALEFLPFPLILKWMVRSCKKFRKSSVVEIYVVVFLTLEILIFVLVSFVLSPPISYALIIIMTIFLGLRLLDIGQSWINIFLVQPEPDLLYASRSLILAVINYIEMILSFSVIGYIWNIHLKPESFNDIGDSLTFTLGTMTAIGSKYEPYSCGAWVIYISEIVFGLLFLIVIVARIIGYLDKKR